MTLIDRLRLGAAVLVGRYQVTGTSFKFWADRTTHYVTLARSIRREEAP